jgi:hypothetical protein
LKSFHTEDGTKGVPPDTVDSSRKRFAYLNTLENPEDLQALECGST